MKLFGDTANLVEIRTLMEAGFVRGITTNPSLLAKEPKSDFHKHVGQIIDILHDYEDIHLSVEVFSRNPEEILRQAEEFRKSFHYEHLSIKVQIGWNELPVIRKLAQEGFSVNCTACMTVNQAMLAAGAGARFISFFWGRIRDVMKTEYAAERLAAESQGILDSCDHDPAWVVRAGHHIFQSYNPRPDIIIGSIRKAVDIRDAAMAGADIVTVPFKFFDQMASHFKTDEVVAQFLGDFSHWMQ